MRTAISRLTILVILISSFCAIIGIFSNTEHGSRTHTTINDEVIETYGIGIYKNDSISMASQAIAQDIVTLVMGVPLLIISLILSKKSIKGYFYLQVLWGIFYTPICLMLFF